MCIIAEMKSADLLAELKAIGWEIVRIRGSHHQLKTPYEAGHDYCASPKEGFRRWVSFKNT